MKILRKIIFLVAMVLTLASCDRNNYDGGITIRGKILSQTKLKNAVSNSVGLRSGSLLTLSDAKKVLSFSKYSYDLTDIVDGAFSAPAKIGSGVALIFLDANNQYIGNLSAGGLKLLPLCNLSDGENTTIDLSTLTLEGTNVIPSHDPFGKEILISDEAIKSLQAVGGYFECIANNIDGDKDGQPDVLTNQHVVINTNYVFNCGYCGLNDIKPVLVDSAHMELHYFLEVFGGKDIPFNGNITLSGPIDDPYTDIHTQGFMKNEFSGNYGFLSSILRYTEQGTNPPFKKGTYTMTIEDKIYTLEYSNIDAYQNLVIATPTIHTNTEGKMTSITFNYFYPDGREMTDPSNIITSVSGQFCKDGGAEICPMLRMKASTGFLEYKPESPVDISSLHHLNIGYDDLLGNTYGCIFHMVE